MRYHVKTSTTEFCDTIATSIARYEKCRCWASKMGRKGKTCLNRTGPVGRLLELGPKVDVLQTDPFP